ncbi:MAG TPA: hypothetical protein VIC33_12085 [Vicinamibacterales bacterium]|jgi:hypothetical protein
MTRRCPHCWFAGIEETCHTGDRSWYHCTACGRRWSDVGVTPPSGRLMEAHPRVTRERPAPAAPVLHAR